MAARDISKPFWGLQFHPESYGSSEDCKGLIDTWWSQIHRFNHDRTPIHRPRLGSFANKEMYDVVIDAKTASTVRAVSEKLIGWSSSAGSKVYYWEMPPGHLTAERISEKVGVPYSRFAVLRIDPDCTVISALSPGSWILY